MDDTSINYEEVSNEITNLRSLVNRLMNSLTRNHQVNNVGQSSSLGAGFSRINKGTSEHLTNTNNCQEILAKINVLSSIIDVLCRQNNNLRTQLNTSAESLQQQRRIIDNLIRNDFQVTNRVIEDLNTRVQSLEMQLRLALQEIENLKKEKTEDKVKLTIVNIKMENLESAYTEFSLIPMNFQHLNRIIRETYISSRTNIVNVTLFLNGYWKSNKTNSVEVFVTGCEEFIELLEASNDLNAKEVFVMYSFVKEKLDAGTFEEEYKTRLESVFLKIKNLQRVAVSLIQNYKNEETVELAKLFKHISTTFLPELVRLAYASEVSHLKPIIQFIKSLPYISHDITCYAELHEEMKKNNHLHTKEFFMLAYRIKETMNMTNFSTVSNRSVLEALKDSFPTLVCNIFWKYVSIGKNPNLTLSAEADVIISWSRHNLRLFDHKAGYNGKFDFEAIEDGEFFRIRNVANNEYITGTLTVKDANDKWIIEPCDSWSKCRLYNATKKCYLHYRTETTTGHRYVSTKHYATLIDPNVPEPEYLIGQMFRIGEHLPNPNQFKWEIYRCGAEKEECVIS